MRFQSAPLQPARSDCRPIVSSGATHKKRSCSPQPAAAAHRNKGQLQTATSRAARTRAAHAQVETRVVERNRRGGGALHTGREGEVECG